MMIKKTERPYWDLDTVRETLDGLAKLRTRSADWEDNDYRKEYVKDRTFMLGEGLRPFYLAALRYPDLFKKRLFIKREFLLRDTERFFKLIKAKKGFYATPYVPYVKGNRQNTDFAAFVLEFCSLAYDFWQDDVKSAQRVLALSKELAQKAYRFLLKEGNQVDDENGCRWSGTEPLKRTARGRQEEPHTDTFFTSLVVLALHSTVGHAVLSLGPDEQEAVRGIIRRAGKWIAERSDGRMLTGNESRTLKHLCYTTWGLRALIETMKLQEKSVRKIIPHLANAYINSIKELIHHEGQDYWYPAGWLKIYKDSTNTATEHKERTDVGGLMLTLISLRDLVDLDARYGKLLAETNYNVIVDFVIQSVKSLRDPRKKTWFITGLNLSLNSYLVEAFLMATWRGKDFDQSVQVAAYMVKAAVIKSFEDEEILNILQDRFYRHILSLASKSTTKGQEISQPAIVSKTSDQKIEGKLQASSTSRKSSVRK